MVLPPKAITDTTCKISPHDIILSCYHLSSNKAQICYACRSVHVIAPQCSYSSTTVPFHSVETSRRVISRRSIKTIRTNDPLLNSQIDQIIKLDNVKSMSLDENQSAFNVKGRSISQTTNLVTWQEVVSDVSQKNLEPVIIRASE